MPWEEVPVRLVKNQDLELADAEVRHCLHEVVEAARRGHDYRAPGFVPPPHV